MIFLADVFNLMNREAEMNQKYTVKKILIRYITGMAFLSFILGSCSYEFPEPEGNIEPGALKGPVLFAGDDFMAGFMDGALYREGQQNGVAGILGSAFSVSGIDTLIQADIYAENGYNEYASDSAEIRGRYVSVYETNNPEPVMKTLPGDPITDFEGDKSLPNDLSVPFLRSYQFDLAVIDDNPYFDRIIAAPGTQSLLQQGAGHDPGVFILWFGMTDLLNYAVSGGAGDTLPSMDPSLIGENDLTPVPVFRSAIENLVSVLMQNPEAHGIVFNLPDINDLPFFYYYSYDFMKLTGSQLGLARTFWAEFNDAVAQNNMIPGNPKRPFIDFNDNGYTAYPQPLIVLDASLPDATYPDNRPLPKVRNLKEGEWVLMDIPVDKMEQGYGWLIPVEEKYYLSAPEVKALQNRAREFNDVIADIANMYAGRILVVDIASEIHKIAETGKLDGWGSAISSEEFDYDGVPLTARLGLNSIYSLDGLHFNQRGCAWISETAINNMNDYFHSAFPAIDVNNHKGNVPIY